jgi:glyoxylase-like metal-dependent hydrolase (beta-lactamase superfamily II)
VSDLAYEQCRPVADFASVVLANNPGQLTLEGTNTWLLAAPDSDRSIVVDPGPEDEEHVQAVLAAAGSVETVLLTHWHNDHTGAAKRIHELTGAPVRALDPKFLVGGDGLVEGDVITAAGLELRVYATPGHTTDSLAFAVSTQDGSAAVLAGDTILGRGTSVIAHPDGNLRDYLASLERLRELGDLLVLPGHGPELPSLRAVTDFYLTHRRERLEQVREALATLGLRATTRRVVERVYADVDPSLWPHATYSVRAQLDYLQDELPWTLRLRRKIGLS